MWRNERSANGFPKIILIPQTFEKQITQFFSEGMFLYVVYYEATLYDIRLNIKLLHDSSIGFSQTIDNPDD